MKGNKVGGLDLRRKREINLLPQLKNILGLGQMPKTLGKDVPWIWQRE